MSDLIDRQAAIDALKIAELGCEVEAIEALPSADPDVPDTNVGDMISRQAAIDAIERHAYRHTYIDQIIDIVKALPSAQPMMKGRWENDSYGAMDDGEYLVTRCSVCGTAYEYGHDDRYCGFCGAEMSEGDE